MFNEWMFINHSTPLEDHSVLTCLEREGSKEFSVTPSPLKSPSGCLVLHVVESGYMRLQLFELLAEHATMFFLTILV